MTSSDWSAHIGVHYTLRSLIGVFTGVIIPQCGYYCNRHETYNQKTSETILFSLLLRYLKGQFTPKSKIHIFLLTFRAINQS